MNELLRISQIPMDITKKPRLTVPGDRPRSAFAQRSAASPTELEAERGQTESLKSEGKWMKMNIIMMIIVNEV